MWSLEFILQCYHKARLMSCKCKEILPVKYLRKGQCVVCDLLLIDLRIYVHFSTRNVKHLVVVSLVLEIVLSNPWINLNGQTFSINIRIHWLFRKKIEIKINLWYTHCQSLPGNAKFHFKFSLKCLKIRFELKSSNS